MSKKRVLFVTQELKPYTTLSEISDIVAKLPQYTHENGMEVRVLMPRFGTINERRHKLHEVVRLSGMNIIVDDDDFPLIIKVASLPGSRLQVYFLDNEEFFKRKLVFDDEDEKPFDDNADRMVFFCKGVMETVKKFGWPPDIIHCHGWMTSLVPLYLKTVYKDEPIFRESKAVYSAYDNVYEKNFDEKFFTKATINNLDPSSLDAFKSGDDINLNLGAIQYVDGIIEGSKIEDPVVRKALDDTKLPFLESVAEEEMLSSYINFYKQFLPEDEEDEEA